MTVAVLLGAVSSRARVVAPLGPIVVGAKFLGDGVTHQGLGGDATVTRAHGWRAVAELTVLRAPNVHVPLRALQHRRVGRLRVFIAVLGTGALGVVCVGGCLFCIWCVT